MFTHKKVKQPAGKIKTPQWYCIVCVTSSLLVLFFFYKEIKKLYNLLFATVTSVFAGYGVCLTSTKEKNWSKNFTEGLTTREYLTISTGTKHRSPLQDVWIMLKEDSQDSKRHDLKNYLESDQIKIWMLSHRPTHI